MYELLLFICGASVMILEIAGVRIISPFFGSSHIVYTSIIGIIMASLSIGYWLGGKLSNKNPSDGKLSLIVFASGLYILILGLFQFNFLRYLVDFNLHIILNCVLSSIAMFSIPSIILGIVSPYTIQLAINKQKTKENTGSLVGRFYAISTIGSIFGTFLCGFYLIIKFGINHIFIFLSCIIFICSVLYLSLELKNKKKIKNISFLIFQFLFVLISIHSLIYFQNNPIEVKKYKISKVIHNSTSIYNYINIIKNDLYLLTDNFYSSIKLNTTPDNAMLNYTKLFYSIFVDKNKKNNILILGNSVGTFVTAALYHMDKNNLNNINFDIVEIDPTLTDVGEKFFGFNKNDKRLKFFYEDARTFLNREKNKKYDLIYYDIYNNSFVFPFHLVTKEAFNNINNILENDGIFVMNIIASINENSKEFLYLKQIYTQLKSEFPQVSIYKVENDEGFDDKKYQNYVICGYKSNNNRNIKEKLLYLEVKNIKETSEIYTDIYSPIEKFL